MKELVVARTGKSALSTDPNDFVFHSLYNTFNILASDEEEITVNAGVTNQQYTIPHGLSFTPLVTAFAKENGVDQVIAPNTENITNAHPVAGFFTTGLKFISVESDATNIYVKFSNSGFSAKTVKIRYFCLEEI